MGRDNSSSIDSGNGHKLACLAGQYQKTIKGEFQAQQSAHDEQIVNARKAAHLSSAKAKARKKAKLAKASRKRNS